jgi:hypothetical protein
MQTITTIGFDIAKSVFQVYGVDAAGRVIIRRQLKRRHVLAFFEKLPPCLVGIEACAQNSRTTRRNSIELNKSSGWREPDPDEQPGSGLADPLSQGVRQGRGARCRTFAVGSNPPLGPLDYSGLRGEGSIPGPLSATRPKYKVNSCFSMLTPRLLLGGIGFGKPA